MSLLETIYNLVLLGRFKDNAGPYDPGRVKKVLVVRNDNIGDVICTTPALDALRQAFPQAHIAALVCTLTEEAIKGHRALDAVYAYPKAKHGQYGKLKSLTMLGSTLANIRKERFDLAVCFRSSFSTSQAWLAYAGKVRWRLGPQARGKKRKLGFYYNLPSPWPGDELHEVERCFHLLSHIQVDSAHKTLYLELPEKPQAGKVIAELNLSPGDGPVVVNVTRWAYSPDRLWPEEKYAGLIGALLAKGEKVVVTHAPGDREWVAGMLRAAGLDPAVFYSANLKEFAAMAALSKVFVTAEGGPMHLAAAAGARLVVLWGRNSLAGWRPWGVEHEIVEAGGDTSRIEVAQVLEAVEDMTASGSEAGEANGLEEG